MVVPRSMSLSTKICFEPLRHLTNYNNIAIKIRYSNPSLLMMDTARTLFLFCDESDREGRFYSNFYGGVLLAESDYSLVSDRLNTVKKHLGISAEMKWSKVTIQYLDRYMDFIDAFFEEIWAGKLKVRIMFRQSARNAVGLTREQKETEYFRLYYQFIKHAFGFKSMKPLLEPRYIRMFFDEFPDKREYANQFKGYILGLQEQEDFRYSNTRLRIEDITEVRSHEHVVMQGLDIVMGAMSFRLNDRHKDKQPGTNRRGKKTKAKEMLYKHISKHIRSWRPGFNIGDTTGHDDVNHPGNRHIARWSHPYRHWAFIPNNSTYDRTRTKRG